LPVQDGPKLIPSQGELTWSSVYTKQLLVPDVQAASVWTW